jgi:hypothetical protein
LKKNKTVVPLFAVLESNRAAKSMRKLIHSRFQDQRSATSMPPQQARSNLSSHQYRHWMFSNQATEARENALKTGNKMPQRQ